MALSGGKRDAAGPVVTRFEEMRISNGASAQLVRWRVLAVAPSAQVPLSDYPRQVFAVHDAAELAKHDDHGLVKR